MPNVGVGCARRRQGPVCHAGPAPGGRLCSLAVYWSSAGQSLNVLNWAMLAPLLLSLLGGPAVISVSLLLVSAITVCVFHALQGFLDPMDLTSPAGLALAGALKYALMVCFAWG